MKRLMYQCSHPTTRAHYTAHSMCIAITFANVTLTLLIKFANMFEKSIFLRNLAVYMFGESFPLAK